MKPSKFRPVRFLIQVLLFGAVVVAATAMISAAAQDKGAAQMTLEGGVIGNVAFPHQSHQKAIADCSACHSLFPQEKGAIADLQGQQKLKKQQVMNQQCIACHKKNKNAGEPAGPVTCSACHNK